MRIPLKPCIRERSAMQMVKKLDLENCIRYDLARKADEVNATDQMLVNVLERIDSGEESKMKIIDYIISNMSLKRWVAVSLCGILVLTGMVFTFSVDARAAAINSIKTIFLLDKVDGDFKLVKKSTADNVLGEGYGTYTNQSDVELTEKLGFNVLFPPALYGDFKYLHKGEDVNLIEKVNQETSKQLQATLYKAINAENAFNSLKKYKPYRSVGAIYKNNAEDFVFITMQSKDIGALPGYGEINAATETKAGDVDASWLEVVTPDYQTTNEKGYLQNDISAKPKGIKKIHYLTWAFGEAKYFLCKYDDAKLTMEDAVKLAESFMEGQKEMSKSK
jgi:hypothetical protein